MSEKKKQSWREEQRKKQIKQQGAQKTHHGQLKAKKKTKWFKGRIIIGIFFAAILIISYGAWQYYVQSSNGGEGNSNLLLSEPAPNFSIEDIDGTQFSLTQFSGKVIVLHFMTVKCQGQIYPINDNQLQQLKRVCEIHCGDKPVTTIITVAVSTCSDENLAQIRSSYDISWVLGNDYTDGKMDIIEAYTPFEIQDGSIILIDKAFNVAKVYTEAVTAEALSSMIDQLSRI
ncbi:MAG: redoxin domain-containing protein [Candidatus Bathyarchaeota archaeon]|nr:MAG: redoxin domain-containing protein [Candidatus Bathyarchaeota archaeon]